jgi:demethoxyubiquinone hydroxylase (CLK1/Coq7/Cat5 family)
MSASRSGRSFASVTAESPREEQGRPKWALSIQERVLAHYLLRINASGEVGASDRVLSLKVFKRKVTGGPEQTTRMLPEIEAPHLLSYRRDIQQEPRLAARGSKLKSEGGLSSRPHQGNESLIR